MNDFDVLNAVKKYSDLFRSVYDVKKQVDRLENINYRIIFFNLDSQEMKDYAICIKSPVFLARFRLTDFID